MQEQTPSFSNSYTIYFIIALSLFCAIVLSILATGLKHPQEQAKELDRSKSMLQAAKIYNPLGYFQIEKEQKYVPALYDGKELVPVQEEVLPTDAEILEITKKRLLPVLVTNTGKISTFPEAKIDEKEYREAHHKYGYSSLPLKLIYFIRKNGDLTSGIPKEPMGYLVPVSGLGLWDYMYGYIALRPDANKVIGISWYEHKETPGLGANITEPFWQNQFQNKQIFEVDQSGKTNRKTSPIGIKVIRGIVDTVFGENDPRKVNAVDGMAGATLTGNGVTEAYAKQLSEYRAFFNEMAREQTK